MVSKRKWRSVAFGLALVPALTALESRLMALPSPVPFSAASDAQDAAGGKEAEARELLKHSRDALKAGDLSKAELLAKQAQSLKISQPFWDKETPEAVLADVATAKIKAAPVTDPKAMLKQARDAINAGKFEEAQALATRAGSTNHRWSIVGDNPTKCLDEIGKARDKANKIESTKILSEARRLFDLKKLDDAEALAYRADRLHGPYGVMEMGDRPQKLLAEIQVARGKERKNGAATTAKAAAKPDANAAAKAAPAPSWDDAKVVSQAVAKTENQSNIQQTSLTAPSNSKVAAQRLLAEGKVAMAAGDMCKARSKFQEASRVNQEFRPDEENPARCLNDLMTAVNRRVADAALSDSQEKIAACRQMAIDFGLDCKAIDARIAQIKANATTTTESTVAAGHSLLEKARVELRNGQFDAAFQLAQEAHNGPYNVKAEASTMLKSVDQARSTKTISVMKNYQAACVACQNNDFVQAMALLQEIELNQLPSEQQARVKGMLDNCKRKVDGLLTVPANEVVARDAGAPANLMPASMTTPDDVPTRPLPLPPAQPPGSNAKLTTPAPTEQAANPSSLAEQVRALQKVEFQRLREEGLKAQTESKKLFERGETDASLEMLEGYISKVRNSQLEPSDVAMLQRPVEQRLASLKAVRSQKDSEVKINSRKSKHDAEMSRNALAEAQKQDQIKALSKQYNQLTAEGKTQEAQLVAEKIKQLDPDNPFGIAVSKIAQAKYTESSYENAKKNNERMFGEGLNRAMDSGAYVDSHQPLAVDPVQMKIARERGQGIDQINQLKTDAEREIQHKLSSVVDLSFSNAPLHQVIDDIRLMTGLNIIAEVPALEEERIGLDTVVNCRLDKIRLDKGLTNLLGGLHLTYVIADDVLKITTEKKARGRVVSKIYRVADLVMPIEDYQQPASMSLERALNRHIEQQQIRLGNGTVPNNNGRFMLADGQPAGNPSLTTAPNGQMNSQPGMSQIGAPTTQKQTMEEMLKRLIQNTISPNTWADVGGIGTIDYMPIGMALVINQTPDVQEQVQDLLNALRRLQDLQVAIEVKLITLSETFFERIGLDFNLNVKTDHSTNRFEPQLTTGNFKPPGQVNDFTPNRFVAGLTPAGSQLANPGGFTSDLDIPIRSSSFQYGIPPFAYPNNPGFDGGLALGLAFLSDIQVYMFMEAAQGDRRVHVMQAPKLTLFNGQTASISVLDQQFFVTNVGVVGFGGQIVFLPQNNPFPLGVEMTLQAVVSADRRFVRINNNLRLANLASANVPLFPVTTFITPVFEGGAQGQPIPFTQFIQQPQLSLVNIQTTVAIPDGGTVILGGLKTLSEGRNEFGPPVLSKVPYVNRLFKNVGFGREAQSLLVMVTPRIIINAEEEERQAGYRSNPDE